MPCQQAASSLFNDIVVSETASGRKMVDKFYIYKKSMRSKFIQLALKERRDNSHSEFAGQLRNINIRTLP